MDLKEDLTQLVLQTEEGPQLDGPFTEEPGYLEASWYFTENQQMFQEVSPSYPQELQLDFRVDMLRLQDSSTLAGWQLAKQLEDVSSEVVDSSYWPNRSVEFRKDLANAFPDVAREFEKTCREARGSKPAFQLPFTGSNGEEVGGELSVDFGLSASNDLFDSHRIVRPTSYHKGLFPVVENDIVVYREVEGLPEILGPNGSTGFVKHRNPGLTDISMETLEDLDKKLELDAKLQPLTAARAVVRVAGLAVAQYTGTQVFCQWWDPTNGFQRVKIPIQSSIHHIPVPRNSDYMAALTRMEAAADSLKDLLRLYKNGIRHLEVIESSKARISQLEVELNYDRNPETQAKFDKALAKENSHRAYWNAKMVKEKNELQEKLQVDLRYFLKEGEEESDLPIVKAIQDHEYYKARGNAASHFLGVHKVNAKVFATSASSRPMLTLQEDKHFSRFPWKYTSTAHKKTIVKNNEGNFVKDSNGDLEVKNELVETQKVVSDFSADDFFFMKTHKSELKEELNEQGEIKHNFHWEEVDLSESKVKSHSDLKAKLDLHLDVMSYIFGGVDPEREFSHGPTEKVKKAIDILINFKPKTGYTRKDNQDRLRDFQSILGAMRYGQNLRNDLHYARIERDECLMEFAELMEERETFYEEVWPGISEKEKKVHSLVVSPWDDRSSAWSKEHEPKYDYHTKAVDLEIANNSLVHGSGEFSERNYPQKPEDQMKYRNESEEECDTSEFAKRFADEVFNEQVLFWTQKRFNSIEAYCQKWQEEGNDEGFPSNKVQNPWGSYGDLYRDLFGRVYAEKYGQRPLGNVGEVKEVVFSDGSIAVDSREQTHSEFGVFLGGQMVNFLEHRVLQDQFFSEVWEDLTRQVWGETNFKEQNKIHQENKKRYTEDYFAGF